MSSEIKTTTNYGLTVSKEEKLKYYKAMEKQTMDDRRQGTDEWDGCDKLADLRCEYPHCTCNAMSDRSEEQEVSLKGRVLMFSGIIVNENMLHQGIYSTDKPNVHWEPDLTIERYIEDTKMISNAMDHEWPEQMYENIRKCHFADVSVNIESQ